MSGSESTSQRAAKRALLACSMIEDEINAALAATGARFDEIVWVERGFHMVPTRLHDELARLIAIMEQGGATQIVMAFGLCGGGVEGLCSEQATLVLPRFDDCVNFMLETGERCCRGKAKAGVFYLTRGWSLDKQESPTAALRDYTERFGERKAKRLISAMFGAYTSVALIENGCYDLEGVMPHACETACTLGVDVTRVPGSNMVLEKLFSGKWDDDILVCEPGRAICQNDFAYQARS